MSSEQGFMQDAWGVRRTCPLPPGQARLHRDLLPHPAPLSALHSSGTKMPPAHPADFLDRLGTLAALSTSSPAETACWASGRGAARYRQCEAPAQPLLPAVSAPVAPVSSDRVSSSSAPAVISQRRASCVRPLAAESAATWLHVAAEACIMLPRSWAVAPPASLSLSAPPSAQKSSPSSKPPQPATRPGQEQRQQCRPCTCGNEVTLLFSTHVERVN